ncbi:MAG TPA: flagellar biosynthetic protein FliO [Polyangiaceae bacterium]|nr:flagellar biosynthetic protein FliO [Polyangiaceae bacterium]
MSPVARYVVETTVTLLAIIALAVLVLYAARRVGVGKPGGPLSLVGRLPLDGRRAIYLIRVGGKVFVVGGSEAGLSKLGEGEDDGLTLTADPPPAAFSEVLSRVLSKKSPSSEAGTPDDAGKSDDGDDSPKRESAA